jgi:guanylate kinase
MKKPLLIVVSAPSGAGKSTLCDKLMNDMDGIVYSISCTTRQPRGSEVDGKDYRFLDDKEFSAREAAGEFLEHAVVHGRHYGTLRKTIEQSLAVGTSVLMDIDVQGAGQIRDFVKNEEPDNMLRRAFVDIFIAPPSLAALRERLVGRAEDASAEIDRRMAKAQQEMDCAGAYRHLVVNDDLDTAYDELLTVIRTEQRGD